MRVWIPVSTPSSCFCVAGSHRDVLLQPAIGAEGEVALKRRLCGEMNSTENDKGVKLRLGKDGFVGPVLLSLARGLGDIPLAVGLDDFRQQVVLAADVNGDGDGGLLAKDHLVYADRGGCVHINGPGPGGSFGCDAPVGLYRSGEERLGVYLLGEGGRTGRRRCEDRHCSGEMTK